MWFYCRTEECNELLLQLTFYCRHHTPVNFIQCTLPNIFVCSSMQKLYIRSMDRLAFRVCLMDCTFSPALQRILLYKCCWTCLRDWQILLVCLVLLDYTFTRGMVFDGQIIFSPLYFLNHCRLHWAEISCFIHWERGWLSICS